MAILGAQRGMSFMGAVCALRAFDRSFVRGIVVRWGMDSVYKVFVRCSF